MTAQLGLRTKIWERGNSHMECKWNHRENTGITNTTAEKENWHCDYNRKKKKNKRSEDIGNYIMIYSGVPANQWASSGVAIWIRKGWKHKIQDYTWTADRIIETGIKVLNRNFTYIYLQSEYQSYLFFPGIWLFLAPFPNPLNSGYTHTCIIGHSSIAFWIGTCKHLFCVSSLQRSITFLILYLFWINYFVRNFWHSIPLLQRNSTVLQVTRQRFWNIEETFGAACTVLPHPHQTSLLLQPALQRIKLSDESSVGWIH